MSQPGWWARLERVCTAIGHPDMPQHAAALLVIHNRLLTRGFLIDLTMIFWLIHLLSLTLRRKYTIILTHYSE